MKINMKNVKPVYLVGLGVVGYILNFIIGGVVGSAIALFAFICLLAGIGGLISDAVKNSKNKKETGEKK
jgi:hypothetical protein